MKKLHSEDQLHLTEANIATILKGYGMTLKSFTFPEAGIANSTAIVITNQGKKVLRVYRQRRKSEAKIKEEVEFALFLKEHSIPVPGVFTDTSGKFIHKYKIGGKVWNCLLMEFVTGQVDTEFSNKLIKQLAQTQAKMHILGGAFAGSKTKLPKVKSNLSYSADLKNFSSSVANSEKASGFIKRAAKFSVKIQSGLSVGYNHMDLGYGNFLIRNEKLTAILDFDDLEYGPSVNCLAYTLADVMLFTAEIKKVRLYISNYQKVRSLNRNEIKSILPVMLYRNYVVGCIVMMLSGPKELSNFIRAEKLMISLSTNNLV